MKRITKVLAILVAAGSLLAGCGKAEIPDGIYQNGDTSFNFGKKTVIVTEGAYSSKVDYTIKKNGDMVIAPDTDEVEAVYDAEHDVVEVYGKIYSKDAAGNENTSDAGRSILTADNEEAANDVWEEEDNADEAAEYDWYEDVLSGTSYGLKDGYRALIDIVYRDAEDNYGHISWGKTCYINEDAEEEIFQINFDSNSIVITGENEMTIQTEGKEEIWTYDEEKQAFSNGEVTFYKDINTLWENEIGDSELILTGHYRGKFWGSWGPYKRSDHHTDFIFHEDGSVETFISIDENFMYVKRYCIKDGRIYLQTMGDDFYQGTYDYETGNIVLEGMELMKVEAEEE